MSSLLYIKLNSTVVFHVKVKSVRSNLSHFLVIRRYLKIQGVLVSFCNVRSWNASPFAKGGVVFCISCLQLPC